MPNLAGNPVTIIIIIVIIIIIIIVIIIIIILLDPLREPLFYIPIIIMQLSIYSPIHKNTNTD